ncbi:haloalkane dehalogenase [Chitinophaga nivalis]|uniref:Haloalkane dehalogenase n=1 Tax=Chitinophaga nivalis TaxID=2991709 RepID=A0ABT3IJD1_9BACT|nr:haloalkane dehalogenase [Chitinophaga nivalis]MCW3466256.1 haloalkane dehalogenase [Chitinophaga nivalis]MCW3484053.1 haloalkane dehalogenase [Chitinophaga nivalis]
MQTITASTTISPIDELSRKTVSCLDIDMSYVDTGGTGDPIVFLHGNPTSSYLWRNIIPWLSPYRRCLAPDLAGMGRSGKSPDKKYHFTDHAAYLDAWFEALGLTANITLVLHDWGSALGFYRAFRHPHQIKAIAYMEAIVQPRLWSDFPAGRDTIFRSLRSPQGETMIMRDNFFIETVLPKSIIRTLSEEEMNVYRSPFQEAGDRLPTLLFPRELAIEQEPAHIAHIIEQYGQWMAGNDIPKLLISAEPGALLVGRALDCCRTWPNQQEVTVKGIHYIQEDSPNEIGKALQYFVLNYC